MPFQTTEEEVRHALRFYDEAELDWEILLDRQCLGDMLAEAGSIPMLASALGIAMTAARKILAIQCVAVIGPGGNRKREAEDEPPSSGKPAMQLLAEVGAAYSPTLKAAMIVCAKSSATCISNCPLYFSCWDYPAPTGHERRKRRDCQLQEHLKLTGVLK